MHINLNLFYVTYRPTIRSLYSKMFGRLPHIKREEVTFTDYTRYGNHSVRAVKVSYITLDEALKMVAYIKQSTDVRTTTSESLKRFVEVVESVNDRVS